MARMTYTSTSEHYELIAREEMDEGMDYQIGSLKPDPSRTGSRGQVFTFALFQHPRLFG
jgi:hypothetical protein